MDSLIVILVAVGALAVIVWLVVTTMRDTHTSSSDGSAGPTDLDDGTSHSSDSSGGGDGGGDGGGGD